MYSNSPSGFTPSSKKPKQIPTENSQSKAKKTLFELNSAWSERENVEDAVANLMCLPVTKNESPSSIVKVGTQLLHFVRYHRSLLHYNFLLVFPFKIPAKLKAEFLV